MIILLTIWIISVFIGLCSIPYIVEKEISIEICVIFVICPILNTMWIGYFIYKILIANKGRFLGDIKKLFDIK